MQPDLHDGDTQKSFITLTTPTKSNTYLNESLSSRNIEVVKRGGVVIKRDSGTGRDDCVIFIVERRQANPI